MHICISLVIWTFLTLNARKLISVPNAKLAQFNLILSVTVVGCFHTLRYGIWYSITYYYWFPTSFYYSEFPFIIANSTPHKVECLWLLLTYSYFFIFVILDSHMGQDLTLYIIFIMFSLILVFCENIVFMFNTGLFFSIKFNWTKLLLY